MHLKDMHLKDMHLKAMHLKYMHLTYTLSSRRGQGEQAGTRTEIYAPEIYASEIYPLIARRTSRAGRDAN
jgi:hypothetical protein